MKAVLVPNQEWYKVVLNDPFMYSMFYTQIILVLFQRAGRLAFRWQEVHYILDMSLSVPKTTRRGKEETRVPSKKPHFHRENM